MLEDFTQDSQPQAGRAKQAHGRSGAGDKAKAVDADLSQLDDEVRGTDAYVGAILQAENEAWLKTSAEGAIARITAASQPYLASGNRAQSPEGLRLVEGDSARLSETAGKGAQTSAIQRFQRHWRSVAALAAVMLMALTLSIIYSPGDLSGVRLPGREATKGVEDYDRLETEMAALWEDLDDLEEAVFMASYHIPIAESASYWAMTKLEAEIGTLEADLGAF